MSKIKTWDLWKKVRREWMINPKTKIKKSKKKKNRAQEKREFQKRLQEE